MLGRVLALIGLLAANGFFVAAEFSVVRSRRSRLEAMARAGDAKARLVLRATANLARLLSASQFGITLASIGIGVLAEDTLAHTFAQWAAMSLPARISAATLGTGLAIAVVTYGHVVFGELAPRSAALNHPEEVSRWLVPPLMVFAWLTSPFTWLLNKSAELVLKMFGQSMSAEENVHSADELRILVEQSQEVGALERQDAALIEGVFEFSEKNAREVMTPRTAIDALDIESSLDDAIALVVEAQRSRYPVYEDSIDNIVGLVLAKDFIPLLREPPPDGFTVRKMMRPVHVVPGSREVEEVLSDFKRLSEHMAVVLDEYGGTAGIVTMEDLLEEIVGEILDEYDEPVPLSAVDPGHDVLIPGSMNIGEMNERFGLEVPDDEFTTIGGYLFGALGRLPVVGDRVTASHAVFTVKAMDGRRIETLAVDLHSIGDRRAKQRSEDV